MYILYRYVSHYNSWRYKKETAVSHISLALCAKRICIASSLGPRVLSRGRCDGLWGFDVQPRQREAGSNSRGIQGDIFFIRYSFKGALWGHNWAPKKPVCTIFLWCDVRRVLRRPSIGPLEGVVVWNVFTTETSFRHSFRLWRKVDLCLLPYNWFIGQETFVWLR